MLKAVLLSHLLIPRPAQPSDPTPDQAPDDAERARSSSIVNMDDTDDTEPGSGAIDDDDPGEDIDAEGDEDEDDDDDDPDAIESPPWHRRFRRHLSISRTVTSFSTLFDGRLRRNSEGFLSAVWFRKAMAVLRPSERITNDHLPHYRVTPILSGIIIPFSILLAIPGFTEHWYVRTEQNKTVETRPNPPILNIGMIFSICCAVIANICLVIRFMEKRVKTMTILCVVFLTIHDVISILAVTVFGIVYSTVDGFTYGQSFWMTVCSTIASFITNVTLVVDLVRTRDFAKSGSGLTRKQRALVVIVIVLLTYIAFGALINSFLVHLTFINALYFTIVTIETIGFGDIKPDNTSSRVFICIYAVFGILNLGLLVSMMRDTLLEWVEVSYRRRLRAVRDRRKATHLRRRIAVRWRDAVEWRLRAAGAPIWVRDDFKSTGIAKFREILALIMNWIRRPFAGSSKRYRKGLGYGFGQHPQGMHLGLEALTRAQLEAAAMETGVPLDTLLPPGFKNYAGSKSGSRAPSTIQSTGEGIVAGITNFWREMRSRDGRESPDDAEGQPATLTHARMGRMIAMLGRFALAMHEASTPQHPPQHDTKSRETSPFPQSSIHDLEKHAAADVRDADEKPDIRLETAAPEQNEMNSSNALPPADLHLVPNINPEPAPRKAPLLLHHYDSYRAEMESEEKKAMLARFTIAWVSFLVFWGTGSAIFVKTEGWSFGTAVYFCFITFTTIGYGDWSPETPAGRSVFVAWAMLGVATMTILISVLSDAYSFTYKHAMLHSHVFEKAVKRYRQRMRTRQQLRHLPHHHHHHHHFNIDGTTSVSSPLYSYDNSRNQSQAGLDHMSAGSCSPREPHAHAQRTLEALPFEILHHAQTLHEQVYFFLGFGMVRRGNNEQESVLERIPKGLKELLNEITHPDVLAEQLVEDILQDDSLRKTLFALSMEKQLREINEAAQRVVDAVRRRDNSVALSFAGFGGPEHDGADTPVMMAPRSSRVSRMPSMAGEQIHGPRINLDPERMPTPVSVAPARSQVGA